MRMALAQAVLDLMRRYGATSGHGMRGELATGTAEADDVCHRALVARFTSGATAGDIFRELKKGDPRLAALTVDRVRLTLVALSADSKLFDAGNGKYFVVDD